MYKTENKSTERNKKLLKLNIWDLCELEYMKLKLEFGYWVDSTRVQFKVYSNYRK